MMLGTFIVLLLIGCIIVYLFRQDSEMFQSGPSLSLGPSSPMQSAPAPASASSSVPASASNPLRNIPKGNIPLGNIPKVAPLGNIPPEKPYSKQPIDSLDEYERSAVYQNQGTKEASKQQIRDAMAQYPMDWSAQGPGSQHFQENQEQFLKTAGAKPMSGYSAEGTHEVLPASQNPQTQEEEERKILQTYQPEKSANLLEYSVEDVKTLTERVYAKKGLVPELVKSKQGGNIWEITEVREKDPKIVWEDDAPMTERETMKVRGEEVIDVPYTVSDMAAGMDPFFEKRRSVRDGRYDYTEWTPGLERMFAPTHPVKRWF